MTVICNATPLINFAAIARLDILHNLFEIVLIPQAVFAETTYVSFPSAAPVIVAVGEGWLRVETVSEIVSNIPEILDRGEREAIALALQLLV